MDNLNEEFPIRKSLRYESINNQIKDMDTESVGTKRKVSTKITQAQGTFGYIRVYLSESDDTLKPGDFIDIEYPEGIEKFQTTFISYGKDLGKVRDSDELVDYVPEEDKKVLCLMVNIDHINYNSDHIPFLRSLFKMGRYFQYQLFKYEELNVKSELKDFQFFDINFG
jgi:hypothetical protein